MLPWLTVLQAAAVLRATWHRQKEQEKLAIGSLSKSHAPEGRGIEYVNKL
jgi:hypothetical protein